jgi:hypothetical protein
MRALCIIPIALALYVTASTTLAAGLGTNELAAVRSQGSNSLATFKELITPSNYKLMGFNSTNDVSSATNGEPLLIFTIPLTQLRNYQVGQGFLPLLEPTSRAIIPIMVNGKVRSSTTVRLDPAGWTTANWGQPKLIGDLMGAYETVAPAAMNPGTFPFAVEVPVFNLWFIGYFDVQNSLVLRSTVRLYLGPDTIGQNQDITQAAMYRLATLSQNYNGRPN